MTLSLRLLFRLSVLPSLFFSSVSVKKVLMMLKGNFKGNHRKFQGALPGWKGFFLEVSRLSLKFPLVLKSFNDVSRLFKACMKFKGSFKEV